MKILGSYQTTYKGIIKDETHIVQIEKLDTGAIIFRVNNNKTMLGFKNKEDFINNFQSCCKEGDFEFEQIANKENFEILFNIINENY